ncbi:AfsR/SARP family transcriptional regulator [Sinomonas sp.]|uniref:AfsR/SARP family transcriptional regulator n=1 Tax=Sinomonas sp. TaxID=1914986 RepID=UPI003F7E62E5
MGSRPRSYLAGLLWPESSQRQAGGSVRAAVFKIRHEMPGLLTDSIEPVGLEAGVRVDFHDLRQQADPETTAGAVARGIEDRLAGLELLPGWYDDWVLFQQERWRGFRLAALETIARRRLDGGNPEGAIVAARHAAELEPLRESSQALLIRAQIAAGDPAAAFRTHERFRRRLWEELGLEPSPELKAAFGPHFSPGQFRKHVTVVREPAPAGLSHLMLSRKDG